MEVTLQKASKLSKSLAESIRAVHVSRGISVSIYTPDIDAEFDKARALFKKNIEKVSAFIAASYEIRQLVSAANAQSSVDSLLTERAEIEAKEKFISGLVAGEGRGNVDLTVAKRQIEAAIVRQQKAEYYGNDAVTISILSEEDIEELKTQLFALRRKKNDVTDQLQGINASTRVRLSPKTVEALKEAELI